MTTDNAAPPPDEQFCDEHDRPLPYRCVECGEASHTIRRVQRKWQYTPVDHSDCQEGLGWAVDGCAECAHDEWYERNGHGFSCNCGCNGH